MSSTATAPADFAAADLAAWRGLQRVHAFVARELDAALEAEHGLALISYEVLAHLADTGQGRLRMCDLAQAVGLSRSGLTRLADRLEAAGLIARACCPSDARGAFAVLTAQGGERLQAARPTHQASVQRALGQHLEPEEARLLAGLWERVLPSADGPRPGERPARGSCGR